MSTQLFVWHHAAPVGSLSLNDEGRWSFRYDPGWNAFALSPHLPIGDVREDLAHQRTVEWFFDNLLPEGTLRLALANRAGIRDASAWQLLSSYGQDTAGALSILPNDVTPSEQQVYTPLPVARLSEMIERSREGFPLMAQEGAMRMSLAGVQEKIALRFLPDGSFWLAQGSTPTTHILKPENPNKKYPFCPANEWYCVSLADAVGLKVPRVHLLSAAGHRIYVIDRYDRRETAQGIRRIHQIDLCQARNVPPSKKYEDEAGLSAVDLFAIARSCRVPVAAKSAAMSWMAFNYLIGNGDAHAKNVSFLMTGGKPDPAPAYDLLCVDAYHQDRHLTMSIGGMNQAGWVEGCHWDAFALTHAIDPRAMRTALGRLVTTLPAASEQLVDSSVLTPDERDWLRSHVAPVLKERIGFVAAALAEPIHKDFRALQSRRDVVPEDVLEAIQTAAHSRDKPV